MPWLMVWPSSHHCSQALVHQKHRRADKAQPLALPKGSGSKVGPENWHFCQVSGDRKVSDVDIEILRGQGHHRVT